MNYHDFELCIELRSGDHYPIRAEAHTGAEGELRLDFDRIAAAMKKLDEDDTDREFSKSFGYYLYQTLFQGKIAELYHKCEGRLIGNDTEGIRIRLRINAPELATIPWEMLHDGTHFLSVSTKRLLTRFIQSGADIKELEVELPLRVLLVAPEGSGLDTASECKAVIEALEALGDAVNYKVLNKEVTQSSIREILRHLPKYHVFHFIGHGKYDEAEQGHLVLDSENDPDGELINAESFGLFFLDYDYMKLVILNSCEGGQVSASKPFFGMAPQLITEEIPAVIAMRYPIRDEVAKFFASEFYKSLSTGVNQGRVDACLSYARRSICQKFPQTNEFATPILFMRSKTGRIISLQGKRHEIQSTGELHAANDLLTTQQNNIETLAVQKEQASADKKQQIEEREKKAIAAAEVTKDKIKRWRRKVVARTSVVFLLVAAACWTGLFGLLNLDEYVERRFISFMDPYVKKPFFDKLRLIGIDEGDNGPLGSFNPRDPSNKGRWKANYAKLITDLTNAGARTIVLDIYFERNDGASAQEAEANKKLAAVLDETARRQFKVVVGVKMNNENVITTEPPDELKPFLVNIAGDVENLYPQEQSVLVRKAILGKRAQMGLPGCVELESAVFPSLPLLATMQFKGASQACLTSDGDIINIRDASGKLLESIPVFTEFSRFVRQPMVSIIDTASAQSIDSISESIQEAYGENGVLRGPRSKYEGALVIIGVRRAGAPGAPDVWSVPDSDTGPRSGKRYGVEIQANIISNLMTHTYIRPLSIWADLLLILLFAAIGVFLQTIGRSLLPWQPLPVKIPKTEKIINLPILVLIAPVVYLLIAFLVYKETRVLSSNAAYCLTALILCYVTVGMARKRLSL